MNTRNDEEDAGRDEELIIKLGRELGIDIRGKTRREMLEEVEKKIQNYLDSQHIIYVG